ncbi:MAG: site-specific DNA-methyltransferase, partial [Rhodospirillales bacterium]
MPPKPSKSLTVDTLAHEAARRRNIPTAELEPVLEDDVRAPVRVAYARRNRDLDPQLVWRGKDEQDWSDLVVQAPPLFIQEKVHPKVLVDDLLRRTAERRAEPAVAAPDLFAFYDGLPDREARAEAYQHEGNWQNRMILGDSLQVMASLAEREGLRGKVQASYFDPPYGIRFNSNFQWSTTSRDVKDGDRSHLTREPEQVKAFRDTWRDGIHSYLTYLRDRLTVARDLLTDSGSIFVQIGDENVHRVRALMDEVFGEECFVAQISTKTSGGSTGEYIPRVNDYILWHAKRIDRLKYRPISLKKGIGEEGADKYSRVRMPDLSTRALLPEEREQRMVRDEGARIYRQDNMTSQSVGRDKGEGAASWFPVLIEGESILPNNRVRWKTNEIGMERLIKASRLEKTANSISYVRYIDDYAAMPVNNFWDDIGGVQSRLDPKVYVVQTPTTAIQRCLLMATDPGDLVLDPTCGSGTTAYVAEQWGRRWITMDTSRVALALARTRIMAARFPWYILADSPEGQRKEAEETRTAPKTTPTKGDIRQGFVYERIPRITLKSIANNTEIDVIWERFQAELEPLRARLNGTLGTGWEEWEIPHAADPAWAPEARAAHAAWWERRIARQREIDASIAAKAEVEYLFDKPYPDPSRVRVAGPFTVESLSPHRTLAVGADDELVDLLDAAEGRRAAPGRTGGQRDAADFPAMVIEHLKAAGVQQAHKADRITFTGLVSWPGEFVAAEGRYVEGGAGTG